MKTQVEMRRKPSGVWEVFWQLPSDCVRHAPDASAADVADFLLRLNNFEFVRGLRID